MVGDGGGLRLSECCSALSLSSVWSPTSSRQLATVDDKNATLWNLEQASATVRPLPPPSPYLFISLPLSLSASPLSLSVSLSLQAQSRVQLDGKGRSHGYCSSCWNPHHNQSQLLLSCDSALCCWGLGSDQSVPPPLWVT